MDYGVKQHGKLAVNIESSINSGTEVAIDEQKIMNMENIIKNDRALFTQFILEGGQTISRGDLALREISDVLSFISVNKPGGLKYTEDARELFGILFDFFGVSSVFEVSKILYFDKDTTRNVLAKKFIETEARTISFYSVMDIIYRIENRITGLDPIDTENVVLDIESWMLRWDFLPDNSYEEYRLFKGLGGVYTTERPDLLPSNDLGSFSYFTPEALAIRLTRSRGRFAKESIWSGIQYGQSILTRYLRRSARSIEFDIANTRAKGSAIDFLNIYEVTVQELQRLGLRPNRFNARYGNLYGAGWRNNPSQIFRLQLETYGLDGITGKLAAKPTRHHMDYDKSKTADQHLLNVDDPTNVMMHPLRTQRVFGGPVVHTPQSLFYQELSFTAKEAFLRGDPNPVWMEGPITGQPQHAHYRPRSTRMFYWCKRNLDLYGIRWLIIRLDWISQNVDQYGPNWLTNSPLAQVLLQPRSNFMPHLDVGPP
ncbi:hypothetical protein LCGC14_0690850 [marine sediment metagenome]|uniref:Uncharacterized protein n=1 Tax=marine sediment metagenome TaxID=412755 RepID=A0A0F9QKK3_9ZZZZ